MRSVQLTSRVSWPVLFAAVAAAPVVAVMGMRVLSPVRGPSAALGSDNLMTPPVQLYSPPKTPAEAFALVRTYDGVLSAGFGPSPMISKAPPKPVKPLVEAKPPAQQQPEPQKPAEQVVLAVTSIMSRSGNPLAVINGRPRRVGDVLPGGWTVHEINGEEGQVVVRSETGEQATLKLKIGRE
jgi:hypothetical protein